VSRERGERQVSVDYFRYMEWKVQNDEAKRLGLPLPPCPFEEERRRVAGWGEALDSEWTVMLGR